MSARGGISGFFLVALGTVLINPALAAPHETTHTVQQRPGAIQEQAEDDAILRKRPGRTKYSNITLKRGYISTEQISRWRESIRPQTTATGHRAKRRALRSAGGTFNRELRKMDVLLERWQRAVSEFERLRARRAVLLKRGGDTSKLDARLDAKIREMERRAAAVRNQARRIETKFEGIDKKKKQSDQMLSRVMKTLHELRSLGAASRSGL